MGLLTADALVGLADFVAGWAAVGAAFLAVVLIGAVTLVALVGFSDLTVAGFAVLVTFSSRATAGADDVADALARVVVAGAVSHSVACFASMRCVFFAVTDRFIVEAAGRAVTAGSAAFFAATVFAALATLGFIAGAVVTSGFAV
ncbi:MAG TPA: hypothetical protein VH591_17925 [Ktedonobacterales bacterium]